MSSPLKAIKISDRVYWVGAIDWNLKDFHGYLTSRASTYNAFLVLDDRITLIDTVKAPFREELLARISDVVDPSSIHTVVSNHAELDHSGSLPALVDTLRPKKIIASAMGAKALKAHFHWDVPVQVVKDGESLDLGNSSLTFIETRMLHWPDSMVSYLDSDRVLFSQDGFGMHLSSWERFTDELEPWLIRYEAAKYYANILMPYANIVPRILEKIEKAGVKINIIVPDHGPAWRGDGVKAILDMYARWSRREARRKAVIAFDTMWESTATMARAIGEGISSLGVKVKIMPLKRSHRSDVATELLDAGALVVGAPTLNNQIFPTVVDLLSYLKGLKLKGFMGAAFGSYGWSGESVKAVRASLEEMGMEVLGEVKSRYVPDRDTLERCVELGSQIAHRLSEYPPVEIEVPFH